ncbi:MAG TPA: OmpA family protein [Polyangiaceae bacterium]|nr:OmpA family protein [Polyangiaceae bacterium]
MKPSQAKLTTLLALCVAAAPTLAACGTTLPPAELVDARAEYARASGGEAAKLQPAALYEAKKSLDEAEMKFNEGNVPASRDLAYVAQRKAQYAEAQAAISRAEQQFASADKEMRAMTGRALERYQQRVAQTQADLEQQRLETEKQRATAEQEREARMDVERRLKQALADLGKLASIREEARGTIITLTGSVLFGFGRTDLLPSATNRLEQVADAIKSDRDRDIVIEGYTDNVGSEQANLGLSQMRADRVRDFLVSHGVDANHVKAVGKGEANPIADNATPEGRANNRRVEIVLLPPKEKR